MLWDIHARCCGTNTPSDLREAQEVGGALRLSHVPVELIHTWLSAAAAVQTGEEGSACCCLPYLREQPVQHNHKERNLIPLGWRPLAMSMVFSIKVSWS